MVKNSIANAGDIRDEGSIPGSGRCPGERKWQPIPVFLPGESPWTEEPGGLQCMGLQRVRHDGASTVQPQLLKPTCPKPCAPQ